MNHLQNGVLHYMLADTKTIRRFGHLVADYVLYAVNISLKPTKY